MKQHGLRRLPRKGHPINIRKYDLSRIRSARTSRECDDRPEGAVQQASSTCRQSDRHEELSGRPQLRALSLISLAQREKVMFRFISTATAAGLLVVTISHDASAGWRRWQRCQPGWYAAPVAVVPAPNLNVTPAPVMAQSPSGSSYRSYSYEPVPAYQAPAPSVSSQPVLAPSQSRFFRADRKAHGLSWYRNP